MTAPVRNDEPKTLIEWLRYLKNAATVPPESRDYADAQEAAQYALERISNLNTAANVGEQEALRGAPEKRTWTQRLQDQLTALGVGLMQGGGLGAGEPLAGLGSAIQGKGFGAGAQAYREGMTRVGEVEPTAVASGDVAGTLGLSALPVGTAFRGGTGAVEAIQGARPGVLGRFLTGAARMPASPAGTAAALGAVSGFSAGGVDPGDLDARLKAAGYGAGLGALAAAAIGGLGGVRVPKHRMKAITQNVTKALGKDADPQLVTDAAELAIRQDLAKRGFTPENTEQLIQTWRAGRTPRPPAPPIERPGETITQVAPKGFEVTGVRPTPAPPTTPTILEMQTGQQLYQRGGMPDIGRGKTLPYYPRGGKVEQAFGPQPMSSPGLPTNAGSFEHIVNALRNTPANELPDAINALRTLGVPLGGTEADLIALLTRGTIR